MNTVRSTIVWMCGTSLALAMSGTACFRTDILLPESDAATSDDATAADVALPDAGLQNARGATLDGPSLMNPRGDATVPRGDASLIDGASQASADSGSGDSGQADSGPHCSPLTTCSGSTCTNLNTDPSNCGSCGHACPANAAACLNGACTASCAVDGGVALTNCGGACVDLQTDPNHCGVCATACTGGQQCADGGCACPSGQAECSGACVTYASSVTNCGKCGNDCTSTPLPNGAVQWLCSSGACVTECGADDAGTQLSACNSGCVDTNRDNANCGACGNACGAGATCTSGVCTCPAGQAYCNGSCIGDQSDPNNCGGCGVACDTASGFVCSSGACTCSTSLTRCGSACVDTSSDNSHCGGCNVSCRSGTTCQSGSCQCYGGKRCGNACARTQSDPNNCGDCGIQCTADAGTPVCNGGTCSVSCTSPLAQCGSSCIDTSSDPQNCGGCGQQCANGANCSDGGCACAAGETKCGASCVDMQSDPSNCGACGQACTGSTPTCTAGTCVSGCGDGGLTYCAPSGRMLGGFAPSSCVDLSSNQANCGSCGTFCPPGAQCQSGTCGCSAGQTQCAGGFAGLGLCVDLTSNGANCGTCGAACDAGAPLCQQGGCVISCTTPNTQCSSAGGLPGAGAGGGAACVDRQTSKGNCGFCGEFCTGNLTCVNAQCVCAPPYIDCSGTCTNLSSDDNNCGACGTACTSPSRCQSGVCK